MAVSTEKKTAADTPFLRLDWALAAAMFLVALVCYVRTLAPDVLWSDSGEFEVVAATSGLAHASGYPIYLLIGKLFTLLPFGSIPYRVNLVSAVMAAIAVGGTYLLGKGMGARRAFALVGAVLVLINPLFWWQSVIAEVYAITAAFLTAFFVCAVAWRRTRDAGWLAAGGLLGGLCLGLHHTALLTLPAMIAFLVVSRAGKRDWTLAGVGAFSGVAIALLGYMVLGSMDSKTSSINSISKSASEFGMKVEDFDSPFTRVKFLITARQWSSNVFHSEPNRFQKNSSLYGQETIADLGWPAVLLAVVGLIGLFATKGRRAYGVLFVISWAALFYFVLTFSVFDLEVDFIPTHILLAGLAAMGLQWVQELVLREPIEGRTERIATALAGAAIALLGSLGILSGAGSALQAGAPVFLTGMRRNYPFPVDKPGDAHDYGRELVSRIKDGAFVATEWNLLYPCYYVAIFEQNKPGAEFVEAEPVGGRLSDSMRIYLRGELSKRPVYLTVVPPNLDPDLQLVPIPGQWPLYRLVPKG